MAERTGGDHPPSLPTESSARHLALYSAAWLAGAVPLFALITALWRAFPTFGSTGDITIGVFAVAFPVIVRRLGVPRRTNFVLFLLVVGAVFGVISILTGWGNGLTDEPFTTPRFVTLLWAHQDPYVVPLVFNYVQYGQTIHSYSIYPYLPLLMFLQVPGISYKWFALACWVGVVVLVRRQFDAGILLAQPYVAVMAASGYNDFPVLLLLTVAFVGVAGRRQRWAQLLALGAKQFANAIVIAYYLLRRDWKNVLVTLGVSAAFIVPFVVWSGPVVLCPSVLANRLSSCPSGGAAEYLLNYALWPVWVLAVFYPAFVRAVRHSPEKGRVARWRAATRLPTEDLLRGPSFAVVGISGALVGASSFLGAGIWLGASVPAVLDSALLGFLGLVLWVLVWDGTPGHPPGSRTGPAPRIRAWAVVFPVALSLNLGAVAAALLVGRPPIDGEIVGAFLASAGVSALLFRERVATPRPGGGASVPLARAR